MLRPYILLRILIFLFLLPLLFDMNAQRVVHEDKSVSYTIFKGLFINRAEFTKITSEEGFNKSEISMGRGYKGKVIVNVYFENYYNKINLPDNVKDYKDNEDFAKLFTFSYDGSITNSKLKADHLDFRNEVNQVQRWIREPQAMKPYQLWDWAKTQADKIFSRGKEGDVINPNWGIPIRIEIIFENGDDIDQFESVKIPYMISSFGRKGISEFRSVKYLGLKFVSLTEINTNLKIAYSLYKGDDLSLGNRYNRDNYLNKIVGFGSPLKKFKSGNYKAKNPVVQALSNGEMLVPFANGNSSKEIKSKYQLFKLNLTNSKPLFVLATNKQTIESNLTKNESFKNEDFDIEVIPPDIGSAKNVLFSTATYDGDHIGVHYQLYKITWSATSNRTTGSHPIIITVRDHGPFPIAYNFDSSPVENVYTKPVLNGPSKEKSNLIGSHRGTCRIPGVPENSPWAWERAIYDATSNTTGNYLDIIEIDCRTKTLDEVLVLSHDKSISREVSVLPTKWTKLTKPDIKNYNYTPPHTTTIEKIIFKPLKEYPLKDVFGAPVPNTHMLSLEEAFQYFKCRQTNGAVHCLAKVGYLGEEAKNKKELTKSYINQLFAQQEFKKYDWVLNNGNGFTVMLAMDKIIASSLETSNIVEAFKMSMEFDMENYLIYGGQISPLECYEPISYVTSQDILDQKIRSNVFRQVMYNPIYYPENKDALQYAEIFFDKSALGNPRRKWHVIGCQPQISIPLNPLRSLLDNKDLDLQPEVRGKVRSVERKNHNLYKLIREARKRNKWIEIYGGTPLSPRGMGTSISNDDCSLNQIANRSCPSFEWRPIPEFQWSHHCNFWVSDRADLIYNFLNAINTSGIRQYKRLISIKAFEDQPISYHDNRITFYSPFPSFLKVPHNIYSFNNAYLRDETTEFPKLVPAETKKEAKPSDQYLLDFDINNKQPKDPAFELLPNSKKESAFKFEGRSVLFFEDLFTWNNFDSNDPVSFTTSFWIYYDEDKDAKREFDIINALDREGEILHFALKSVNGKLVWTRSTSWITHITAGDHKIYNYDFVINQGCEFDQGSGWYFIYVSMGNNICRIAMGKEKPMKYISEDYGANYSKKNLMPQSKNDKQIVEAYFHMGTVLQELYKVDGTYFGNPKKHADSPSKIAKIYVSPYFYGYKGPYELFNDQKKLFYK